MPPGPGPVFVYEWLTTTRRWQLYAARAGFVGLVLVGMILAWAATGREWSAARMFRFKCSPLTGSSSF